MKPVHGLVFAFALSSVVFSGMTAWSVWHMAGLYERIHKLESLPAKMEGSRNEVREPQALAKSDPLRNFTAGEANEWLQHCEDTPENRQRWAEAAKYDASVSQGQVGGGLDAKRQELKRCRKMVKRLMGQ